MKANIGFNDYTLRYTQQLYRKLLDSMARPGKINTCGEPPFPREIGSPSSIMGIARTLLDTEVNFSVSSSYSQDFIKAVRIRTGAYFTNTSDADFFFLKNTDPADLLYQAKVGTLNYPDKGATVIVEGATFHPKASENVMSLVLTGPGIKEQQFLHISGLDQHFIEVFQEVNAEFPLGVDLIIVSGVDIACLPRTTQIEIREDV